MSNEVTLYEVYTGKRMVCDAQLWDLATEIDAILYRLDQPGYMDACGRPYATYFDIREESRNRIAEQLRNRDLAVQRGLIKIRAVLHGNINRLDDEKVLDNLIYRVMTLYRS